MEADIRLMVRAHDPLTSVEAAEKAVEFAGSQRERIVRALRRGAPLTAHELTRVTGLTVVQIDRRLPEIQRAGEAAVLEIDGVEQTRGGFRVWAAT